ncbi:hypothetical protein PINS_up000427 [Pythium insidiosum]|nr:hypothetical protein PINS_up000427 [Pythium insidiosum]
MPRALRCARWKETQASDHELQLPHASVGGAQGANQLAPDQQEANGSRWTFALSSGRRRIYMTKTSRQVRETKRFQRLRNRRRPLTFVSNLLWASLRTTTKLRRCSSSNNSSSSSKRASHRPPLFKTHRLETLTQLGTNSSSLCLRAVECFDQQRA